MMQSPYIYAPYIPLQASFTIMTAAGLRTVRFSPSDFGEDATEAYASLAKRVIALELGHEIALPISIGAHRGL